MKNVTFLAACTAMLAAAPALADTAGPKDWKYTDGKTAEKWSASNEDYAMCDAGKMQSPIDLASANAHGDVSFASSYGATSGKLTAKPGKVQVDFASGMGAISGGNLFNLVQLHFHTPAEHVMNGVLYPLVVHLVHVSPEGKLAVLGVMFEEGEANPALDQIVSAVKGKAGEASFDVAALVPQDSGVYRYMGSLTTPPCSEGVNWHVADTVLSASAEQIATMRGVLGISNRTVQALNDRLVVAPEG